MSTHIPRDLLAALEDELSRVSGKDLTAAVRALSDRYRSGHARASAPFVQSELDVLAYAAYRLPATYGAIRAVLLAVREAQPDFHPASLLDIGGGPGTAAWAAVDVWPELERLTILERDEAMIRLGRALAGQAAEPSLRGATWQRTDITGDLHAGAAQLTIAAYVIGEVPDHARDEVVKRSWEVTTGTCVIVEPGTPRGYRLVRQAGDILASYGANTVAPFPHRWTCVESETDWCHFSTRVPRTRLHRLAKESTLSYEDEKYAYVAASRLPATRIAARVIRQPQIRSGHVRLVLCTAEGVRHAVITRSNREAYRRAKDLAWGSAISTDEAAMFRL